jgi:hypothetical protein
LALLFLRVWVLRAVAAAADADAAMPCAAWLLTSSQPLLLLLLLLLPPLSAWVLLLGAGNAEETQPLLLMCPSLACADMAGVLQTGRWWLASSLLNMRPYAAAAPAVVAVVSSLRAAALLVGVSGLGSCVLGRPAADALEDAHERVSSGTMSVQMKSCLEVMHGGCSGDCMNMVAVASSCICRQITTSTSTVNSIAD